jgi:polysaccharide biosynthesis transport protein
MDNEAYGPQSGGPQEEAINLRHYWHIILERRWLVITTFLAVFLLSVIYLFKATPIYQAQARLQIDPETENLLKIEGLSVGGQQQDYLQTQYKNLLGRTLLDSVVYKLKLERDERYSKALDPVAALASDVQVVPIRLSRLVDIKVEHPDKNLAYKVNASLDIVKKLKEETESLKTQLETAEQKLQEYSSEAGKVSFEDSENILLQALKQYQSEYAKAKAEAVSAQKVIEEIDAYLKEGIELYTLPQIANNPDIQALLKQLALQESRFAELKTRYLRRYPTYIEAEQGILELKRAIETQAKLIVAALRNNARLTKAAETQLELLVAAQEQENLKLRGAKIQYDVLKRDAEQSDVLYKTVLSKWKEMDLSGRNKINNIHIKDEAAIPLKPVKPRVMLTLFLGVVGGMGVAVGLAFFVNYLDDSIKSQDDVETYLRLPFLGYVPNIKTNSVVERDLQAHLHPQSNAAEGFRTIRATVSLTHKPEKFRILSVTSTIPSEGKSLVASNLAIVTAQTGLRTLLVDSDMRRPSVHKAYQLHSPKGLSGFLAQEVDNPEEIIHSSEVPNLDIVCCGSVPTNPSELISSKRMMDFLEMMRTKYDRIILDCPPISAVSDPLIISALTDGVVFVTKFNKIRRDHARKSVQRLHNAGIHVVGLVLNDIDFEGKDSYYYSYYYYQNRYYASHYKNAPAKESVGAGRG